MQNAVTVYGSATCKDTIRTRAQLNSMGVQHMFVNIDHDRAAEQQVRDWNGGERKTPTVALTSQGRDRQILSVPSDEELSRALKARGLVAGDKPSKLHDTQDRLAS